MRWPGLHRPTPWQLWVGTSGLLLSGACSYALYELVTIEKSRYHTWRSLVHHYVSNKLMAVLGYISYRDLYRDSLNVRAAQSEFLLGVLRDNQHTPYGRDHHFEDLLERVEPFRLRHPLTRISHYQTYIDRIVEHDERAIMTADPAYMLAITSGTSGQCSLIPTNSKIPTTFFFRGIATMFYSVYQMLDMPFHITQADLPMLKINHQKSMKFMFPAKKRATPQGLRIGPNSSNPEDSQKLSYLYVTPHEAYGIRNEANLMYVHLLFGLRDPDLGMIEANFANLLMGALNFMSTHWKHLVEDIRNGTLTPPFPAEIDPDIRSQLESNLVPDPDRAEFLDKKSRYGFSDIVIQIWPRLHTIVTTTSGSMEPYRAKLRQSFVQFGCIYSPIYGATEGLLGVNTTPNTNPYRDDVPNYTLMPRAQFFEFIPVDQSHMEQPTTLLLHELKSGQEYEVVITNNSGLYRYRLGDVVKVHGYMNEIPKVEFCYRVSQILNLRGEKVTEPFMDQAIRKLFNKIEDHPALHEYTCVESPLMKDVEGSSQAPHYVIFVECKPCDNHSPKPEVLSKCLEDWFAENHGVYKSFKTKGSIGPIEVKILKEGTFRQLEIVMKEETGGVTQFKIPRVVSSPDRLKWFMGKLQ
ncbi:hypothetical protein TCAL_01575 [Tigriopus californicus]|uniref:GH3 domain-containing protein n=1 Tax=Tigriopus californicus TaxID=6832 RepID=A0A553P760_TIGCA|nr:uncharacterized protein LOC131878324 [Tigriopus californicus]XP_059080252.1 uncharacterized protein LOC131878324 [Tigriopus californicus]TRY73470.1 hypothetical protein TCAL_01575 [Tigriopus californicus]|eukprot:TCALIF_01575-PA protein Name:"Similar to GH3.8 Probable indole-3-acetic acid-amido synthetase GH3.8 (Oryza sativa subsp. japonica)" AED:0.01 eAED:0.01 QI:419/1/1/1/0.66/0.5/4/123/635